MFFKVGVRCLRGKSGLSDRMWRKENLRGFERDSPLGLKSRKMEEWSIRDVIEWGRTIDVKDPLLKIFEEQEVSGKTLYNVTVDELLRIGVPLGVAKAVHEEVQKLKYDEWMSVVSPESGDIKKELMKIYGDSRYFLRETIPEQFSDELLEKIGQFKYHEWLKKIDDFEYNELKKIKSVYDLINEGIKESQAEILMDKIRNLRKFETPRWDRKNTWEKSETALQFVKEILQEKWSPLPRVNQGSKYQVEILNIKSCLHAHEDPVVYSRYDTRKLWDNIHESLNDNILKHRKTNTVVLGNPGIGKTRSSDYLMKKLFEQEEVERTGRVFFYLHGKTGTIYAFQREEEFESTFKWLAWSIYTENERLNCEAFKNMNNIYVMSSKEFKQAQKTECHQILECSPRKVRYHEFCKEPIETSVKYILPPPKYIELLQIYQYMKGSGKTEMTDTDFAESYDIFGESLRYIFLNVSSKINRLAEQETAVNSLEGETLARIIRWQSGDINNLSSAIFTFDADFPYLKSSTRLLSRNVRRLVCEKHSVYYLSGLHALINDHKLNGHEEWKEFCCLCIKGRIFAKKINGDTIENRLIIDVHPGSPNTMTDEEHLVEKWKSLTISGSSTNVLIRPPQTFNLFHLINSKDVVFIATPRLPHPGIPKYCLANLLKKIGVCVEGNKAVIDDENKSTVDFKLKIIWMIPPFIDIHLQPFINDTENKVEEGDSFIADNIENLVEQYFVSIEDYIQ